MYSEKNMVQCNLRVYVQNASKRPRILDSDAPVGAAQAVERAAAAAGPLSSRRMWETSSCVGLVGHGRFLGGRTCLGSQALFVVP